MSSDQINNITGNGLGKRPTVLLADDDPVFLARICQWLSTCYEIVGTAEDGEALLHAAHEHQPDLIVSDISMPRLNGFQAAQRLKIRQSATKIVFLSVHEDPVVVSEAIAIGVAGFVFKRLAASDLIPALKAVFQGGHFISGTPS